jgi:hypothetical protein
MRRRARHSSTPRKHLLDMQNTITAGCQSAAVGARRVADADTDSACRRLSARAAAVAAGGSSTPRKHSLDKSR